MIGKKGFTGLLKGTAGIVLLAVFAAAVAVFFVVPIFAGHTASVTVTPTTVNQFQNVTLNFTVTPSGGNMTNVTINFTAAGWDVPTTNTSIVCPLVNGSIWNATAGAGGIISCINGTVTSVADAAVNVAIKGATLAPGSSGAKVFVINTTDQTGGIANASATVTVVTVSANATLNDTTAQITSQKSYRFRVTNNGTDTITKIFIGYTNWTNDTATANVTCPTIGDVWTASVDTANDRISCAKPDTGSALGAGASANIDVSNWIALNAGGVKILALTVTGTNGGNYTETLNNPNLTVFGTASTTFIDNATANEPISRTLVDVLRINITSTGEQINVTAINIALSGTVQEADIVAVMVYNETTPLGAARMDRLATNSTRMSGSGGNVTISFTAPGWIIPANSSNLSRVVLNISTAATGGRTFTGNITAAANITMSGFPSAQTITTSGTFPAQATTTTIFGNLSLNTTNTVVTGNTVALANAANFTTLHINLTANGEQMNSITLAINTTATVLGNLTTIMVYNDTGCDGGNNVVAADKLINATSAAPAATQNIRLGNATFNETIAAGVTRCYFVAYNVSTFVGGGNTFSTLLAGNNATATGASSSQAITSYGADGQQSVAAEIQGNITVSVTNRSNNTVVVGTIEYETLTVNLTAGSENMTTIRFIVDTTGNGNTTPSALLIARDNNTDGVYGGQTQDTTLNTTTSVTGTVFLVNASANETIPSGESRAYLILYNIGSTGGGNVFTTTIAAANITATGGISNNTITGIGTGGNSSVTTIYGNMSIDVVDATPNTANNNQTNVTVLAINITTTGELVTIEQINFTINATALTDVLAVKLFNDTNNDSTLDSGEPLVATATLFGNIARFGTPGSRLFNVETGARRGLLLVYDMNVSAVGGNRVDGHIAAAANITVKGNASLLAIDPQGTYPVGAVGSTLIKTLSAVANLTDNTAVVNSQDSYTIIINNTGGQANGDDIDQIVIDYTNWVNDTIAGNITCPSIVGVSWNRTLDTTANTITCNNTGPNNLLGTGDPAPNASIIVSSWVAPNAAGIKNFTVTVRGTATGTFIVASSPNINVSGNVTMQVFDKAAANVQIGGNITAAQLNITSVGEALNTVSADIETIATQVGDVTLIIYKDGDCSGTVSSGDLVVNTTSSVAANTTVRFGNATANETVSANTTQCYLVYYNVSSNAAGGNSVLLKIGGSNITATGSTSGASLRTANATSYSGSTSRIYGTINTTLTNVASSTVTRGDTTYAVIRLNFTARGEAMNINSINISLTGNATAANLSTENATALYNDTNDNAVFTHGTDTIVAGTNVSITGSTVNLTPASAFVVPNGTSRILFVVYNVSSTALINATIGTSINRSEDIGVRGGTSAVNITPTSATISSTNATIQSASALSVFTVSITPTNASRGQTGIQVRVKVNNTGTSTVNITVINLTMHRDTGANLTLDYPIANTTPQTTIGGETSGAEFNFSINVSSTATIGRVTVNATATGTDANTGDSVSDLSSDTTDTLDIGTQASLANGTMIAGAAKGWITFNQTLNATINISIPYTNNGNSSAVTLVPTFALLNSTNGNVNSSFTLGRVDSNTSLPGNAAVTSLTYQINASSSSPEGAVRINISLAYNDDVTAAVSTNSPVGNNQASVFQVDAGVPAGTYLLPTNGSAQKGTVTFNISVSDGSGIGVNATRVLFELSNATANSSWTSMTNTSNGTHFNGTFDTTTLADGEFNISLNVTDLLANQFHGRAVAKIIVDNTGATFANESRSDGHIKSGQSAVINSSITDLTFNRSSVRLEIINSSGTVNTSVPVTCAVNTGTSYNCTGTWNGSNNTGAQSIDGNFTFRFNHTDNASTATSFSSNVSVFVDNTNPSFSGSTLNTTFIKTAASIRFNVSVTDTTFNSSNVQVVVLNLTNATVNTTSVTCATDVGNVYNCTVTWNGTGINATGSAGSTVPDSASYRFAINSTDNSSNAGNFNSSTFTVDNTAPTFGTGTFNVTYIQTGASMRFNISVTDLSMNTSNVPIVVLNSTNATVNTTSVTCVADASTTYNCTLTWNGTGINQTGNAGSALPDGLYRFGVNATDNSSNSANTNSSSFTIDSTAPTYAGERRTDGHINNSQTSAFYINVTDTNMNTSNVRLELINSSGTVNTSVAVTCTALSGTTYNCSGTWNGSNNTGGRTQSNFTFRLNVTDNASVSSSFSSNLSVFADDTAPSTTISTPADGAVVAGNVSINFTLNDTVSGVNQSLMVFQINATTFTPTCSASGLNYACNFTWETNNGSWPDTSYNITVLNTTDNSSNLGSTAQITVTVNNIIFETNGTAPTGTITSNSTLLWVNTTEPSTCKFDTSDVQYASMTFTMNGSGTKAHNYTLASLLDGQQQLRYVKCRASDGNQTTTQLSFTVDTRSNFNITIPGDSAGAYWTTGWRGFSLPKNRLENTSLTNFNVTSVLSSLGSNYNNLQAYNGTSWQSYIPGDAVNSFVNFSYNGTESYWVRINASNQRIQIN